MDTKKFSVLSVEQVFGDGKLDVFRKYGSDAEVTDYAISRGTDYFPLKSKYFIEKGIKIDSPLLNKKVCDYWTSSKVDGSMSKCFSYGKLGINQEAAWSDDNGIRVVVPFKSIKKEVIKSNTEDYGNGEVRTVLYGAYPQRVLNHLEMNYLDKALENGELKPTGKKYAAWGNKNELFSDGCERNFERDEFAEYEYNGVKYVKGNKAVFENGSNRRIWAVVEPIEWIVDEKTGLAITKKCIIGGIPLNRKGIFLGDFESTLVQDFIDNEFSYDISLTHKELDKILNHTEVLNEF